MGELAENDYADGMTLTLSSEKRSPPMASKTPPGAASPPSATSAANDGPQPASRAGGRGRRWRGPGWFWGGLLLGISLVVLLVGLWNNGQLAVPRNSRSNLTLERIPFDGQRAYEYLQAICAIGPKSGPYR